MPWHREFIQRPTLNASVDRGREWPSEACSEIGPSLEYEDLVRIARERNAPLGEVATEVAKFVRNGHRD